MRRYAYGFVNSHDFDVARQIMAENYTLRMGTDVLVGRDDQYLPAVQHQIEQFPGLSYSIQELVTDGEFTAVYFTEHGRSLRQPDRAAAWVGIGIYRAEGGRLAECWVEQDHFGRRLQLETGIADPVPTVAIDPWSGHEQSATAQAAAVVDRWVGALRSWPADGIRLDNGQGADIQPQLTVDSAAVAVVVAEGDRVAFNIMLRGAYGGGLPNTDAAVGRPVELSVALMGRFADGALTDLHGVTNRVAVQRQLR